MTTLFFIVPSINAQSTTTAYSPLEDADHEIVPGTDSSSSLNVVKMGSVPGFRDLLFYKTHQYDSIQKFTNSCGGVVKGTVAKSESNNWGVSTSTTTGGSISGEVGGEGKPKGSAEISRSITTTVGVGGSTGTSASMDYSCPAAGATPNVKPTAAVKYSVKEISGEYLVWHLFSDYTEYEFHFHQRTPSSFECELVFCETTPVRGIPPSGTTTTTGGQ
ncbi:hypothetical protein [Nitrosopumilus sp.]|uniref:hypothetical protein n=1 Tax=Nitrosopumilus sp. TaxID=2024843 RepID=UPI003D13E269